MSGSLFMENSTIKMLYLSPSSFYPAFYVSLQLFSFTDGYKGTYKGECPFYCSYSGYHVSRTSFLFLRYLYITSCYSFKTMIVSYSMIHYSSLEMIGNGTIVLNVADVDA